MRKTQNFTAFLFWILSSQSEGMLIKSDSEFGKDYISETLLLRGEGRSQNYISIAGWSIEGGVSRAEVEDSANQGSTAYLTENLALSVDVAIVSKLTFSLSVGGSQTKESSYEQILIGGILTYLHSYGEEQSWQFGYGLSSGEMNQDFEFTILGQKYQREVNISQIEQQLFLSWTPKLNLSFQASFFYYDYNKSKDDLALAFQSRFLNNRAAHIVFSIASLPDSKFDLGVTQTISDVWDLHLRYGQTQLIAEERIIQESEITGMHYLDNWFIALGLLQSHSDSRTEDMALFQVGFDWL